MLFDISLIYSLVRRPTQCTSNKNANRVGRAHVEFPYHPPQQVRFNLSPSHSLLGTLKSSHIFLSSRISINICRYLIKKSLIVYLVLLFIYFFNLVLLLFFFQFNPIIHKIISIFFIR